MLYEVITGVRNFNRSATKVAGVAAAVLVIVTTLSLTGVSRSSAGSFFSTVIKVFRDDVRINTDMNEPPPSIIPPPPNDYDEKQDNAWSEEVAYADFEEFVADNQGQELYDRITSYNVCYTKLLRIIEVGTKNFIPNFKLCL